MMGNIPQTIVKLKIERVISKSVALKSSCMRGMTLNGFGEFFEFFLGVKSEVNTWEINYWTYCCKECANCCYCHYFCWTYVKLCILN